MCAVTFLIGEPAQTAEPSSETESALSEKSQQTSTLLYQIVTVSTPP